MSNGHAFFRVDGNAEIGSGHVIRCLHFADALALSGRQCTFLSASLAPELAKRIRHNGHSVLPLPCGDEKDRRGELTHAAWLSSRWQADADAVAKIIGDASGPAMLIVDHYALDAKWEAVAGEAAWIVIAIDDLADRPHKADMLVDLGLAANGQTMSHTCPPAVK